MIADITLLASNKAASIVNENVSGSPVSGLFLCLWSAVAASHTEKAYSRPSTKGGALAMPYEEGMQIVYDMVTRMVVVVFRDQLTFHGPFATKSEAYSAGEAYCRKMGWVDHTPLDMPEKS